MRYKKRRRLAALGLAAVVALGGLAFPAVLATETKDDNFVGSFNLKDIFSDNDPHYIPLEMDKNDIFFSDPSGHPDRNEVVAHNTSFMSQLTLVTSKRKISLKASWQMASKFIMKSGPTATETIFKYSIHGLVDNSQLLIEAVFLNGSSDLTLRFRKWNNISATIVATYDSKVIPAAKVVDGTPIVLSYDAATGTLTCTYGDTSISLKKDQCDVLQQDSSYLRLCGQTTWRKESAVPTSMVRAQFEEVKYTKYNPKFVETTILNSSGQPMSEEEKRQVQDGDIVTIRAKVNNTFVGGDPVPVHLKLADSADYPTAMLNFDSSTWATGETQEVKVDGHVVNNVNITGTGIPLSCKPGGTEVTYRAKVTNPEGKAVTIGQMIEDDFFLSKQYSKTELAPAVPLVPYDPEKPAEEQGTAGKDYHFTRTPANQNGWNNSPVEVVFCPGDFDQFEIKEGADLAATLDRATPKKVYGEETGGTETVYQAKNSGTKEVSTTVKDQVKIDQTAPAIAASGGLLTLTDSLSGVWKVERYDAKTGHWVGAKAFALTDGNGAASQTFAVAQNGRYRAVDAAGNASPPLAITVNDPPSVDPSDPSVTPSAPEKEVDENGLVHITIRDHIQEIIDREVPLYGGRFTVEEAQKLFDSRYGFSSHVPGDTGLTYAYAITQDGKDVTGEGVDATQAGSFTVTCIATDADGNTTTVILTDTLIDRDAPPVVDWGEDPDPPVGPSFDSLKPLPKPVIKDDPETGRKHAHLYDSITEVVDTPPAYSGRLTAQVAAEILKGRYQFGSAQGDGVLTRGPVAVTAGGKDISTAGLDTSKPGSCVITQTVTDSQGNQTTVHLQYTFVGQGIPPVIEYDPNDPTVEPGSRPDGPEVVEDWQSGTKYATVKDRLVQTVTAPPLSGGWLDEGEIRSLLSGRYRFTSAQPDGGLKEIRFAVTQNGKAVDGIDTTKPGEYVVTYTLEDSSGNRTTLFLQFVLQEGGASADTLPDGNQDGQGGAHDNGSDGAPHTGEGPQGSLGDGCLLHWLELAGLLLCLTHMAFRLRGTCPRERGEAARLSWGDSGFLSLMAGAALYLAALYSCAWDLPLAALWGAVVLADLALLAGRTQRRGGTAR
ncbi:DUF5011 domain-containing protein [Bittarella massiliensis (ex Durand et al. 2017)]|uniref:DUF5011 domain-containing protein n=1 Tax=Bittarella massiliensis (ex Durand et al. 2017) TaxID=1720313 RepID=A0AAW5KIC7_9FIRM|nr:DUF5011 domain-containing protein [Bittarella massiliensis (ex Durand et al. 2017)]MCQ4949970.1 DUF5011 domain-containing protein [Bittarella massiliensis (ex Durand et al. 2017)]